MLTRELYEDFEVECIYIEYEYILLFSSFLSNFCYLKIPAPILRTSCTYTTVGWADFCLLLRISIMKASFSLDTRIMAKTADSSSFKSLSVKKFLLGLKRKKMSHYFNFLQTICVLIKHNFVQAKHNIWYFSFAFV